MGKEHTLPAIYTISKLFKTISNMRKYLIMLAALVALAACAQERTPEEKVADLITARFDSLAVNCKVVSVSFQDTLRQKLTTADPEYKKLTQAWRDLMSAGADPFGAEYTAARNAMADYEAAWVGEPIALKYSCIVECEDMILKAMVEGGGFAVSLDHSKILDLD